MMAWLWNIADLALRVWGTATFIVIAVFVVYCIAVVIMTIWGYVEH